MLVSLLNVPRNKREWDEWSLAHKLHHDEIRQKILALVNINLPQYVLDPINQSPEWLKRNAQSHNDMNGVARLQGSDLEDLDFEEKSQVESWIHTHYLEHYGMAKALGI